MTEFLRPDGDITVGNWTTQVGGTSNLYQSVDEASADDSDYVKSGINPINDTAEFTVSNPAGLLTNGTRRIRYSKGANNSTVVNLKVELLQDTTLISEWVFNDIPFTPTTSVVTLTAGELALITVPNNLKWRYTANPAATGWTWSSNMQSKLLAWSDAYHVTTGGSSVTAVENRQPAGAPWVATQSGAATLQLQSTGWDYPYDEPDGPCIVFNSDFSTELNGLVNNSFLSVPNGNYWSMWCSGNIDTAVPHANRIISIHQSGGFKDFDQGAGFLGKHAVGAMSFHMGSDIDVATDNTLHGRPQRLGMMWNNSQISVWDNGMLSQPQGAVTANPMTPVTSPWTLASLVKLGIWTQPPNGNGGCNGKWRAFVATHGGAGDLTEDNIREINLFLQYPNGLPTASTPQVILGSDLLAWIDPNTSVHTFSSGSVVATVQGLEPAGTIFNGMSSLPPERLPNLFGAGNYGWLNNTLRGNNYGATLETSISTGGVSSKPLMGGVARSQNTAAEFNWMTLQMFDTLWFHQVTGSPSIRSYGVSSTGLLEQFKQWVTPGHRFRYLIWIDAANGLNFLINGKYFNVGHSRAALPSSATLRWGGQGNAGSGTYGNAAHGVALWGLADNITDAKIRALDVYLATWAKGF